VELDYSGVEAALLHAGTVLAFEVGLHAMEWDYCMQAVSIRVTHAVGDGGLSSAPLRIMRCAPA